MRRFAMVLILLNLALAGANATTTSPGSGIRNCCRGEGEEAFCCLRCCWFAGRYCTNDAQCRDPNLETPTLEPWNADDSG